MKTIEQKAKAYDEAIKKAREYHNADIDNRIMEYLFPELIESEDEHIRKELIEYIRKTNCINFIGKYSKKETEKFIDWLEKQGTQKLAEWGEEDEKYITAAIELVTHCSWGSFRGLYREAVVDWLKSIKNRVQPKAKGWCEDDYTYMNALTDTLKGETTCFTNKDLINWLESLKTQPKQELSEEDKDNIQRALYYVDYYRTNEADTKETEECFNWLKSLKQRIGG